MRRHEELIARARDMRMDAEVGTFVDRMRILGELANALSYSDSLIEQALVELRAPLDPEVVLDTHAGRALWGTHQAGKATRILCQAELLDPETLPEPRDDGRAS